jgi:hypothetical protein
MRVRQKCAVYTKRSHNVNFFFRYVNETRLHNNKIQRGHVSRLITDTMRRSKDCVLPLTELINGGRNSGMFEKSVSAAPWYRVNYSTTQCTCAVQINVFTANKIYGSLKRDFLFMFLKTFTYLTNTRHALTL